MLATMNDRSFVVTIAYIKTEAIQVALFGLIFLGDPVTLGMVVAILVATAGVVVMSLKGKGAMEGGYRPVAARAVLRRDVRALRRRLSRRDPVARAAELRAGRDLHADGRPDDAGGLLTLYLALRDRAVLHAICGPGGRRCSQASWARPRREFWFLAFALTSVANVRTLALVEVLFAQAISFFIFKQATTQARGARHDADRDRSRCC